MIPKKTKEKLNKNLTSPNWTRYDDIRATAWHEATGLLIEEWEEHIEAYCRDRGRDCFFGTNEHGKPVAVFDAKTNEEFVAKIKHERFLQEKKYEEQGYKIEKKRT